MESARRVRIAAAGSPGAGSPPVPPEMTAATEPGEADRKLNRSGGQRAVRTFAFFLGALVALYGIFLEVFLTAPEAGVRSNPWDYALTSVLLVAFGVYGYALTVLKAPRYLAKNETEILVGERTGRIRHFPTRPGLVVSVLKRYPSGPLSDEPTEMVRVSLPNGTAQTYLVDEGFFPALPAS